MHPLLLNIPEKFDSERLTFRRYQHGDGAEFHNAIESNPQHLALAVKGAKQGFGLDVTTHEGCELFVRNLIAGWEARQRLIFPFWSKESCQFVGELWIECKDWEQGIHEIGYFVVQSETGKGIATEAARAGVQFIFEHLNAHKVALTCDEDNVPSWRVAESAGFVREGHIRDAVQRPDGSRVGVLIYGLLRSEVG